MSKICSKCLETKSLNEFTDSQGECIKCKSLDRRERNTGQKATEYKRPQISIMRKVNELMHSSQDHYAIAQKIIDLAVDGDKDMIKWLVERLDGKVTDKIEMSGEVINTNVQVVATADELRSKIRNQIKPKTNNSNDTPTTH